LMGPNQPGFARMRDCVDGIEDYVSANGDRKAPGFKAPVLLNLPMPHYTEAARSAKISGMVRAVAQVLDTGAIGKVVLLSHLGYGLDEEAIDAVQRLKLSPATLNGKAVNNWVFLEVEFKLR
ncbi:MAG TPA: energy transducer TonB, partial [Blastocatellia bacterium]|nr:energy transducer TonB [Blastocatellia bacterium]